MAIFTKVLTTIDVERSLSFPDGCLRALPRLTKMFPAIMLLVKDDVGGLWNFRCVIRSGVVQRLVIVSGWIQFVQSKELHSGDTLIVHKDEDTVTGAHYKFEVKRNNSFVNED